MTYEERKEVRGNVLTAFFDEANPIEESVFNTWRSDNYPLTTKEIKDTCDKICKIAQEEAKPAFTGQDDLYKRFCDECEEITNRFMKLNEQNPLEAVCGVSQICYYLYEEIYDLASDALELAR